MDKTTQDSFLKGIHTDNKPIAQPKGTLRYALNAIREAQDGSQTSYINEIGNKVCATLPTGYQPIGCIDLPDNKILIFLTVPHGTTVDDMIVIQDENCELTTVITENFNFSINHQIHGIVRVRKGCNRTIYFTDNHNPLRSMDIDDLDIYNNSAGNFDVILTEHFPPYKEPCISFLQAYNSGGFGTINTGSLSIVLRYSDRDFNPTSWFTQTAPIYVVDENYGNDYEQIDGAVDRTVNKSYEFRFDDIDQSYEYVEIGMVEYATETGEASAAYYIERIPITGSSMRYLYKGVDQNTSEEIDLSDVRVSKVDYKKVRHLTQYDNTLILGNLESTDFPHAALQQAALDITAKYFVGPKVADSSAANHYSPKSPKHSYSTEGYMRDEVYAFGIVWVRKDGTESPVYHIPGRAKNRTADGTLIMDNTWTQIYPTGNAPNDNLHNRPNGINGFWDEKLDWSGILPNEIDRNEAHLTITNPERWQVCNTAIRTHGWRSTTATKFENDATPEPKKHWYSEGELAYYESTNTYPDDVDCDGNAIFGALAGTPIRFHRMPDTTLEPHFLGLGHGQYPWTSGGLHPTQSVANFVMNLGVLFNDVALPTSVDADDYIGYKIVRAQRDIQNRTVVDKGLIERNRTIGYDNGGTNTFFNVQADLPGLTIANWVPDALPEGTYCPTAVWGGIGSDESYSLHTPFSKFYKSTGGADYIKVEQVLRAGRVEYAFGCEVHDYLRHGVPQRHRINRNINNYAFLDPDSKASVGLLNNEFINYNQQETLALDLENGLDGLANTATGIPYEVETESGNFDFNNLGNFDFISRHYVALKNNNQSIYGPLSSIEYIPVTNCNIDKNTNTINVYGGDTTISKFAFRKHIYVKDCDDTEEKFRGGTITWFWTESPINTELRHAQDPTLAQDRYWPKHFATPLDFLQYELNEGVEEMIPNTYYYNKDYSAERDVKVFFPLPQGYKYCNNCNHQFPNRIVWSQKGDQEQLKDMYKIFLADDYRNIPGQTGEVTGLFYQDKTLYTRTKESLWRIHTSDQQLESDISTISIGSGKFMKLPPVEIVTTNEIYGGTNYQWTDYQTQFGHVYATPEAGKILLLGLDGQLKELSEQGNRNWFEEHLPIKFLKQYQRLTSTEYPFDNNPAYINGIGVLATYDTRFRRYILTKKDYRFLEGAHTFDGISNYSDMILTYGTQTTPVVYVGDGNYTGMANNSYNSKAGQFYVYQTVNGAVGSTPIDLTNGLYFENLSWTISYSFKDKTWISFHSYIPNFYFNNNDNFYSTITTSQNTWEHNTGDFQEYYGKKHDHILEYILNPDPLNTHYFSNLHWLSSVSAFSTNTNQYYDVHNITFDRLVAYNEHQCTGLQTIDVMNDDEPYKLIDYSGDTLHARRTNRNWKVSKLRDYVYSYTDHFFTKHWMLTRPDYPIDKVLNNNMISHTKDQYQLSGLKDKWLGVRLFFKPRDNYKITTDICKTILLQDFR